MSHNTKRQIKLGAFVPATGHHVAAWRHEGANANGGHEHWYGPALTQVRNATDVIVVAVRDEDCAQHQLLLRKEG